MRFDTRCLLAGVVVALTTTATAQSQQPILTQDPQAVSVVQQTCAFIQPALAGVSDAEFTGEVRLFPTGGAYPVVLRLKDGVKLRVDILKAGRTISRISDEKTAVASRQDGTFGPVIAVPPLLNKSRLIPWLAISADCNGIQGAGLAYSPNSQPGIDDVTISRLSSSDGLAVATTYSIDGTTKQITNMRTSDKVPSAIAPHIIDLVFSDYRDTNGIAIPFHQSMYVDGKIDSELVISDVKLNVGLSDALFTVKN